MTFEDMISPLSASDLLALIESRPAFKFWHSLHSPDGIFSWDDFYDILSQQRTNTLDVAVLNEGIRLHPSQLTHKSPRKFGHAQVLNTSKLKEALACGGTIRISRADEKHRTLETLASHLETLSQCHVNINLYASFTNVPALLPHADTHDVLVIQLAGAKSWRVYGFGIDPLPIRHPTEQDCPKEPVWTGTLNIGDILFIPRGSWHSASLSGRLPSLHMTIGINHIMLTDLATWLGEELTRFSFIKEHLLGWNDKRDEAIENDIRLALAELSNNGFLARFRSYKYRSRKQRFTICSVDHRSLNVNED